MNSRLFAFIRGSLHKFSEFALAIALFGLIENFMGAVDRALEIHCGILALCDGVFHLGYR